MHTKGWTLFWAIFNLLLGLGFITIGICLGNPIVIIIYCLIGLSFGISSMREFLIYKEKRWLSVEEKYHQIVGDKEE